MQKYSIPTPADWFDYLLRLYFGTDPDRIACCVARAYLDLSRTLHGLAHVAQGEVLRHRSATIVRSFLAGLAMNCGRDIDQNAFDDRHKTACSELCTTYSAGGFNEFHVGQAQKWLNIALKYVFALGEDRLRGFEQVFRWAHIPIDNMILDRLGPFGFPRLKTSWSRISSYEEYMGIQRWVRSTFAGSAPLAVEFFLWQNSDGQATSDSTAAESMLEHAATPKQYAEAEIRTNLSPD